ncbi:Nucleotidyl transferase AbiEii toxin, Type IV TA system [Sanguibacter gelidistatuariae]|uniref:Nucleotidyl transferase AbiEii toxin, Type IV TA system n=1 Tax=Sanguibacter gelidistatuariae TaxID=1814289 RepID=A0A1G6XF39_9MICO|nr:nucleotidyl transferase AbiEii/AbiGii toxin family protein [Sanguibacter gelidistatuariae]SDD76818.1 Nucleotidyl transferase AbiEii toxin, Type IV TA system [Sanguibacter gelidistatuariae]
MTPPVSTRDTPAGRAYNDLRSLARREGRDQGEYITLYVLEGFLIRLATSEHAEDFVLKGGVLMAAFAARRPTRDIDLAATGIANDVGEVEQFVRRIVDRDVGDGLVLDSASVAGEPIRDTADYAGVRVKVTARLGTGLVALHVDVNFGDPIWPAPTEAILPLLLGATLALRGYPDHMVLAEKIVTAIDRGEQNTRWRDFVDIAAIAATRRIRYADLRPAIDAVASTARLRLSSSARFWPRCRTLPSAMGRLAAKATPGGDDAGTLRRSSERMPHVRRAGPRWQCRRTHLGRNEPGVERRSRSHRLTPPSCCRELRER